MPLLSDLALRARRVLEAPARCYFGYTVQVFWKMFTIAAAVSLLLIAALGCSAPATKPAAPPTTREEGDVSVALKDLGPSNVTILASGEQYRLHGGGLDVVCMADDSSFLIATPDVRVSLLSAEQMRYRRRAWSLLFTSSDAVSPPPPSERELHERVQSVVVENDLLSAPLSCIPDRLTRAITSDNPHREQCEALARAILRDEPIRLIGQSRTANGMKAWQAEIRLTAHGRAKLRAALSALSASGPATVSPARAAAHTGERDSQ